MDIKSKLPLNFDLIGNPVNWIILLLMISSAGLALVLVSRLAGGASVNSN